MPREKLCGEFFTPEFFPALDRLGGMERLVGCGAPELRRLSLITKTGKTVKNPIAELSDEAQWAMGLSRARFDQILFDRARESGAVCLEGIVVKQGIFNESGPCGVEALISREGRTVKFEAPLIIDSSGRNSPLIGNRCD